MERQTMNILRTTAVAVALAGCSAPNINLSTAEPIKVDIAMRLDVYQHNKDATKKPTAGAVASDPETRRRNRMADIQSFKNSRLVGEGSNGLLSIRVDTPGEAGDYMRKTVASENEDRSALMAARAEKEQRKIEDIRAEQAALWRQRSFEGELIELSNPDGTFAWMPKSGR
jgi:hypothetical protein